MTTNNRRFFLVCIDNAYDDVDSELVGAVVGALADGPVGATEILVHPAQIRDGKVQIAALIDVSALDEFNESEDDHES